MKNNKQIMYSIIGIAILLVSVVGLSFAFFNYTRTGQANTIRTGNISFNSTQDNTISLTNVFPTSKTNLNSTNSDTVTINITGDTTYSEGIEYKVTLESVNNNINGKEVPISIKATATNLGTEDSNYYTNRENKTNIYLLNEEGEAYNGKYIAVGYIPAGSTGVNGSIDITAFIDTNKVAISDTYDGTESDLMGTTNDWVMGIEVFTTTEWNSFQATPLSFKVKVEANEGIWVEQEKFLTMKNLNDITDWINIRADVTSIEFHKDGIAPANYVNSFDVTDESSDPSKGSITLYTVDDGLGTNTYKAIVVANDTIYAPEDSTGLFMSMTSLVTFNSKDFKTDNVIRMASTFSRCSSLSNISSLTLWNTSNVTSMATMFLNCSSLIDINSLGDWNISNVTSLNSIFALDNGITKVNDAIIDYSPISGWDTSNVTSMSYAFQNNNIQSYLAFSNWNVSNVTTFIYMFQQTNSSIVTSLEGLENWNVSKARRMNNMFNNNINLEDASAINGWNINASASFNNMFQNTPSHPEFTKFPNGTWDANGTFSPNA